MRARARVCAYVSVSVSVCVCDVSVDARLTVCVCVGGVGSRVLTSNCHTSTFRPAVFRHSRAHRRSVDSRACNRSRTRSTPDHCLVPTPRAPRCLHSPDKRVGPQIRRNQWGGCLHSTAKCLYRQRSVVVGPPWSRVRRREPPRRTASEAEQGPALAPASSATTTWNQRRAAIGE